MVPSKAAAAQAATLERLVGTAGAGILATELLGELLVAVDDSITSLDLRLRREAATSLAGDFESTSFRCRWVPWGGYRTTVDAIESATGYNLLSNVSSSIQSVIESKVDNGPTQ